MKSADLMPKLSNLLLRLEVLDFESLISEIIFNLPSVYFFERADLIINFIERNITSNSNIRLFGSNCLDLANTASGRIDGYFSDKLNNIKISAGLLIVRESGGMKIDMNNFNYSVITNNLLAETFKD